MMKKLGILAFAILALVVFGAAQDRVFDWQRASDEIVQLDPTNVHTGRVYHAGSEGGNMHIDIHARRPVTVAMVWADQWNAAMQHPEAQGNLEFRCLREHVLDTTYECHLPSDRPMLLTIRDERTPDRVVLQGIEAIWHKSSGQFISPNDVDITYYSWVCVQNCVQPEFQWFRLVKEKYEITTVPKIYSILTPERDGQPVNLRVKAPVPVTIALLPSQLADQVYDHPETLSSALSQTSCKQRGVQSLTFDCTVNLADGPQSLIVVPASSPNHKKAEIELQAVKCVNHCELMNINNGPGSN
jgi:hypothetical protein